MRHGPSVSYQSPIAIDCVAYQEGTLSPTGWQRRLGGGKPFLYKPTRKVEPEDHGCLY